MKIEQFRKILDFMETKGCEDLYVRISTYSPWTYVSGSNKEGDEITVGGNNDELNVTIKTKVAL